MLYNVDYFVKPYSHVDSKLRYILRELFDHDEESLVEVYFSNNQHQILLTKDHILVLRGMNEVKFAIRRRDVELVLGNKDAHQIILQLKNNKMYEIQLSSLTEADKVQQMLVLVPNMN